MRLINVNSFELKEFSGSKIPQYAILSHTWEDEEVSFKDWQNLQQASKKVGYAKIYGACQQARTDGHEWLWVDTNCIDKTSSAELSEAINSMFRWYRESQICYAYLQDVPTGKTNTDSDYDTLMKQLRKSRWFTRGWTLQELLAPKNVVFHARDWSKIGTRERSLSFDISLATGIDGVYLAKIGRSPLSASAATKMSWLSNRNVSREEDLAYCMLGLFDINMPLLYGEGMKAFIRLQEEIIKSDNDQSIFCWEWIYSTTPVNWSSFLAPSPRAFRNSSRFRGKQQFLQEMGDPFMYQMTNAGLSIELPVLYTWTGYIVALSVDDDSQEAQPWIEVSGYDNSRLLYVSRQSLSARPLMLNVVSGIPTWRSLIIRHKPREESKLSIPAWVGFNPGGMANSAWKGRYGILPIFQSANLQSAWVHSRQWKSHDHENILWLDMEDAGALSIGSAFVPNLIIEPKPKSEERRVSLFLGFICRKWDVADKGDWICRPFITTVKALDPAQHPIQSHSINLTN